MLALVAPPMQRAAAPVATQEGAGVLSTIEPGAASAGSVENVLTLSRTAGPIGYCTALCRLGAGFALVSDVETIRCRAFGTQPEHFTRVESFRPNAHGLTVGVARGGLSDDPSAALLLLQEPQVVDGATRYALLRLDESTRQARWEWTDDASDPPALNKEDSPIPDFWCSSSLSLLSFVWMACAAARSDPPGAVASVGQPFGRGCAATGPTRAADRFRTADQQPRRIGTEARTRDLAFGAGS